MSPPIKDRPRTRRPPRTTCKGFVTELSQMDQQKRQRPALDSGESLEAGFEIIVGQVRDLLGGGQSKRVHLYIRFNPSKSSLPGRLKNDYPRPGFCIRRPRPRLP